LPPLLQDAALIPTGPKEEFDSGERVEYACKEGYSSTLNDLSPYTTCSLHKSLAGWDPVVGSCRKAGSGSDTESPATKLFQQIGRMDDAWDEHIHATHSDIDRDLRLDTLMHQFLNNLKSEDQFQYEKLHSHVHKVMEEQNGNFQLFLIPRGICNRSVDWISHLLNCFCIFIHEWMILHAYSGKLQNDFVPSGLSALKDSYYPWESTVQWGIGKRNQ
jgi:hypothetical protein